MTQTTHNLTTEQYTEPYRDPGPDAPRSTGYVDHDNYPHLNRSVSSFDKLISLLTEKRESITPEQLAEISAMLSGNASKS
jgi:hypothetical protein